MRTTLGVCACLVLSACGYDTPPRELRPVDRGCGPLSGDYVVDDADLRWLAPPHALSRGVRYPFLHI